MTKIEWTEKTWNPVTGCTKLSPGCKHCYAERMSKRLAGRFGYPKDEPFRVTIHVDRLEQPLKWKKPRKIFVNSMSDLFHKDVPFKFIDEIFAVMASSPQHAFQILTKRPERMREYLEREIFEYIGPIIDDKYLYDQPYKIDKVNDYYDSGNYCGWNEIDFPDNWLDHIWLGTSIENKGYLGRMKHLKETSVATRFISFEPLLDSVGRIDLSGIHWVIAGCESGPKARPMDIEWAREIKDQCFLQGVAFFMKQIMIDGKLVKDIERFPEDLQIREYPNEI